MIFSIPNTLCKQVFQGALNPQRLDGIFQILVRVPCNEFTDKFFDILEVVLVFEIYLGM